MEGSRVPARRDRTRRWQRRRNHCLGGVRSAAGSLRSVHSCYWRSRACSTRRAPRQGSTPRGRTVTSRTGPRSTCWSDWSVKSNDSLPDSGTAFWRGAFFLLRRLEAMDANLIGGDIGGGAMDIRPVLVSPDVAALCDLRRATYIYVRRRHRPAREFTECADTTPRAWRFHVWKIITQ